MCFPSRKVLTSTTIDLTPILLAYGLLAGSSIVQRTYLQEFQKPTRTNDYFVSFLCYKRENDSFISGLFPVYWKKRWCFIFYFVSRVNLHLSLPFEVFSNRKPDNLVFFFFSKLFRNKNLILTRCYYRNNDDKFVVFRLKGPSNFEKNHSLG